MSDTWIPIDLNENKRVTKCIFCENLLTKDTKPEHILLNALGGRKTTKRAICSDCNNHFGATIDKELAAQVSRFRNMLQLDSGTGKPPPSYRAQSKDGEDLLIRTDGVPEFVMKPFDVRPRGDGKFDLKVNARDLEDLRRSAPHIAAQIGIPLESLWQQIVQANPAVTYQRADEIHHQLSLGGEDAMRSIMKACFCLLSTIVPNDTLRDSSFNEARAYVLTGSDTFTRERGSLDPRRLPVADTLEQRFGPLFNFIIVRSDEAGRVVGHFTLYNILAWQVVLAESNGPSNLKIAVASNPLDPATWSDTIALEVDTPFAWLDTPDREDVVSQTQARMVQVMEVWHRRGTAQLADHITKQAFERHGIFDEHEPIRDPAMFEAIKREIAEALAHHLTGLAYQRPINFADVEPPQPKPSTKKSD